MLITLLSTCILNNLSYFRRITELHLTSNDSLSCDKWKKNHFGSTPTALPLPDEDAHPKSLWSWGLHPREQREKNRFEQLISPEHNWGKELRPRGACRLQSQSWGTVFVWIRAYGEDLKAEGAAIHSRWVLLGAGLLGGALRVILQLQVFILYLSLNILYVLNLDIRNLY